MSCLLFLLLLVCNAVCDDVLHSAQPIQKQVGLKFTFFKFDMLEESTAIVRVVPADSSAIWMYFDWNKPPTDSTWLSSKTSGLLESRIDACDNGTLYIGVWNNNYVASAVVTVTVWSVSTKTNYCSLSYQPTPWFFQDTYIAFPSAETLLFVNDIGTVQWFSSHTYLNTLYANVSIELYKDVAGPGNRCHNANYANEILF